jgi:peptidyl-prolyl cis-trans isomerase SurA
MLVLVGGNGWAQTNAEENLELFSVAENPVSAGEFIYLYNKNNQKKDENFTREKILEYLDLYINFKLKVQEAKMRGMDTTSAFVKELDSYKVELKKPYLAEANDIDRLAKEAFQRMNKELKVSHILVNVPAGAQPADTLEAYSKLMDLRTKALHGEEFEKLAREFSDDPTAKSNGGSLGYFTAFQMVYPFESAAYKTPVDEVSLPVRTRFGYHIIKVYDKRNARGEVEASHIFIRGSAENARIKIFEVVDHLKAGRDWIEVCKEYSEDPNTNNSGGKLRPFGVGALASAPEFEDKAFSMTQAGEISDPFQTRFGWHILRLERKIPVPTYDELESVLKRRVARDERMQISKDATLEKRKRDFDFKVNSDAKQMLMDHIDSTLSKGTWIFKGPESLKQETLFTLSSKNVLTHQFIDYLLNSQNVSALQPDMYANQLFDRFVEEQVEQAEDVQLQKQHPEYRNMLKEYHEGILMFSIMEEEVWNKASDDSLGQRAFYEAHPDKYMADDRIEARIFSTGDKDLLDRMKSKIAVGDTLTEKDIKEFKSVLPFRKYEKGENEAVDRIGWSVGLKEAEVDGMYYLVEVSNLVAPGKKSFMEVRASVISDYQDYLEKQWLAALKTRYKVSVNAKGKKYVLKTLVKK